MIYGRRQGRKLSPSRKSLLQDLLPKFQIQVEEGKPYPLESASDVWMEIGFGTGDHLMLQASRYPNVLMIGCEPFVNGVGSLLGKMAEADTQNIRIFMEDAKILLRALPDESLGKIFLLFPDPWPKKGHHKRRFVSLETLALLWKKLKVEGTLLIATDHPSYKEWIQENLENFSGFERIWEDAGPPKLWVTTRFQEKATKEGREAWFVELQKK
jgi:tRNA (guanine-N7-)-methyltransferase